MKHKIFINTILIHEAVKIRARVHIIKYGVNIISKFPIILLHYIL